MKKINSFLLNCILCIFCMPAFAQTSIPGGNVSGNWTLAGSPYLIQGSVIIPTNLTLTIDPGVNVIFQTSSSLKMVVQGRLLAIGTVSDSISFTASDTTNGFGGIRLSNIAASNDTSKMIYCKFQYGKAQGAAPYNKGGALYFNNWSKAIVSQCYIANCNADLSGGAICCDSSSSPVISYNTIMYNYVTGTATGRRGAGIACQNGSAPSITYNVISYNSVVGCGAGISCEGTGSNALISYNTISYNSTNNMSFMLNSHGAGIFCSSCSPTISYNTISYNANLYLGTGGGIYCGNVGTFPAITRNTITYNSSSEGGGIGLNNATLSGITFNIISNNNGNNFSVNPNTNHGGGIYCNSSTVSSLSNNSITNNYAPDFGGAIFLNQSVTTSVLNNTIANNRADYGGALYCDNNSDPTFRNCILFGNTALTAGPQVFLFDEASDPNFSYSDVEGGSAAFALNGNFYTGTYAGNNINSNPLFVSPSGGSGTAFDGVTANWSLQTSLSPCINTGDPATLSPSMDVLGNTRVTVCRVDMGAYEDQYAQPLVLTVTSVNTVCGQLCTGSASVTVTGGSGTLTYSWTPGNLTTAGITNQCAGTYTVKVTEGTGCTKTAVKTILANPTMTSSFIKTPTSCFSGANGTAQVNVTNGAPNYSYLWSANAGSQTSQTATALAAGTYTVLVTDQNSCTISPTVTVVQPTDIMLNKAKTNASCMNNDGTASVAPTGGTPGYTYAWSTGGVASSVSGLSSGIYTVTVTDNNLCPKSDTVNISINPSANPPAPSICLVTVDSLSVNNIIYWDKTGAMNADSFIVHREVSTNVYKRIGAVSIDSLSMFVDTARMVTPANGDPNIGYYHYKLQIRDSCGNYSALSPYHTSVYFIDNQNGTFTWNIYDVQSQTTPVSNFNLLRDDNNTGNYVLIGAVAGTTTTLNDPNYFLYQTSANWRVDAAGFNCTPTLRYGNNGALGAVVKSRSNVKNNRTTGNQLAVGGGQFAVFPNPASTELTIVLNKNCSNCQVEILNMLGETVKTVPATGTENKLDISDLNNGVYFVKVKSNGGSFTQKLLIQH